MSSLVSHSSITQAALASPPSSSPIRDVPTRLLLGLHWQETVTLKISTVLLYSFPIVPAAVTVPLLRPLISNPPTPDTLNLNREHPTK